MEEKKSFLAEQLWKEGRGLADTVSEVEAYVVPASGVGWIEFMWRRREFASSPRNLERKRLVCDWAGQTRSAVTRQVIALADEWFVYCEGQARREAVVLALAQNQDGGD